MTTCKLCDEKHLPMKALVYHYGELQRKTCNCGTTYLYVSKIKFIDLKNGHIRMEMPD